MASNNKQVVKVMADEIIKAINTLLDSNNRNYVSNQIDTAVNNQRKNSSSDGGIMPGTINASQVKGLYNTVAAYIVNAQQNADSGDSIAGSIVSTLNGIAQISVQSAKINTANIVNLTAAFGDFIHLVAEKAEIQDLDVDEIYADIAEIGISDIHNADIDYAHIKDLQADRAIFREGVGNKLFMDRLAVSDANIVSLAAGSIMLKDNNGNMVRLTVDGNGTVSSEVVDFDGDDIIAQNTLSGGRLIENTITARELNVSSIFADTAMIRAVKAANLDVTDMFSASNAFVGSLSTYIINSPTIGAGLDISGNSSIQLTNNRLALIVDGSSTSSNLILTDAMIHAITDQFQLQADTIDFSANESIASTVSALIEDEIDDIEDRLTRAETSITANTNAIALKASQSDLSALNTRVGTLEVSSTQISSTVASLSDDLDDAEISISSLTQRATSIETTVANSSDDISQIIQEAGYIYAVVEDEDEETSVTFTPEALEAIADSINLTANNTIRITSAGQIEQSAIDAINLRSNNSLNIYIENDTNLGKWIRFDSEGMTIRKPSYVDETTGETHAASKWSTVTKEDGYYINHDDVGSVGAFHKELLETKAIQINELVVRPNGKGGWVWVDS